MFLGFSSSKRNSCITAVALVFVCLLLVSGSVFAKTSSEWTTEKVSAAGITQRFFYSAAAKARVSFHVYTPPSYSQDGNRRFPVIYWLHGHGEASKHLSKIAAYFDRAMSNGKIPQALVIFPNGMAESMWCNSKDGQVPMETVIVEELIPQVDKDFLTIPTRNARLIEGFSMGGYGAARLGIKYNEMFGSISLLGAGPMQAEFNAEIGPDKLAADRVRILKNVYGNDQSYFAEQSPLVLARKYAEKLRNNSKIRIVVGGKDTMKEANKYFSTYLLNLSIPNDFYLIPNAIHNPIPLFISLGETNWEFYRKAFEAVE